jgi:hypothetical protein
LPIEKRETRNFEFSHNLKWYIIRISFERVLRNIQTNLLLIVNSSKFFHGLGYIIRQAHTCELNTNTKDFLFPDSVYHVDWDDVLHNRTTCNKYSIWQVGGNQVNLIH